MQKELSISKHNLLNNVVCGATWIMFGVFRLFDNETCQMIATIFLALGLVSSLIALVHRREKNDEMSVKHRQEAESLVLRLLLIVIMAIGLYCLVGSLNIDFFVLDFTFLYPFLIGGCEMAIGFLFMHYEKVGC